MIASINIKAQPSPVVFPSDGKRELHGQQLLDENGNPILDENGNPILN